MAYTVKLFFLITLSFTLSSHCNAKLVASRDVFYWYQSKKNKKGVSKWSEKSKKRLIRSASPTRSEEAASTEDETPVEPIKQERNLMNGFVLNGVQPFVREKSYRPISFNPQPPPPIPS